MKCKNDRMFKDVTVTWNPVTGCLFGCRYCWASRLVNKRLRKIHEKYKDGFTPRFHPRDLSKSFKSGDVVFVVDMGDLFGDWVRDEWITSIIERISMFPNTEFMFLTKNPHRYNDFSFPNNVWLGATIETDLDELFDKYRISKAPKPSERIRQMMDLDWDKKFISIEPILAFSEAFPKLIELIDPLKVYIGYDNYGNMLPEPKLADTLWLIEELEGAGITVIKKTIRPAWFEKGRNSS